MAKALGLLEVFGFTTSIVLGDLIVGIILFFVGVLVSYWFDR